MAGVFLGSEAIARGALTRGQLRWNYRQIHRDVYLPKNAPRSLRTNIYAAWLWSGRRGIIAGRAAAALHGAKWVDDFTPIEVVGPFNHPPPGIIVRRERIRVEDLVDLGTELTAGEVAPLIGRHRGARGVRQCQTALSLMDGGAQSPKETWLRLVLIDAGLPRPLTQIRVTDGRLVAYLDLGCEEPLVALEYDGDQHRNDRRQYVKDVRRAEMVDGLGWHVIKVINEDRPNVVIQRARDALARRSTLRLP